MRTKWVKVLYCQSIEEEAERLIEFLSENDIPYTRQRFAFPVEGEADHYLLRIAYFKPVVILGDNRNHLIGLEGVKEHLEKIRAFVQGKEVVINRH